ncbi:MAG: NAD(P)/FAD-dependent oxidoreductase [Dehalococcoidia bacterium]|nr:NAD(P)/FAD-dependent oxidoreductase [Dehalococcoidia bacterium]
MIDAIVIGAGPAGSRVAGLLAKKGYQVTVLEDHVQAGDSVCCTGIVGAECFGRLTTDAKVLSAPKSALFHSPGGRVIRLEKGTPQAYVLERASLDRSLAQQAQSDGARFIYGCSVEGAARVNGHVEVDSVVGKSREVFSARVVVLAAGFNPGLISRIGVGGIGDFAVGAQVEADIVGVDEVEVGFSREFAPGFFTWIVPTGGGKALIGLICRERPKQRLRAYLSHLRRQGKVRGDEFQIGSGRIPLKPSGKSYGDRLLAVGDAAGQVKPTTGGGIYYGLLCAEIAADVLDKAFRTDNLSASELGAYQRRWRKALDAELSMGYLSRQVFERLGDRAIDTMFDIVKRYSLDKMALDSPGFSFDWHGGILRRALNHAGVRATLGIALTGLWPNKSRKISGEPDIDDGIVFEGLDPGDVSPRVRPSEECAMRS